MRILVISNQFPPKFIGGYELGALDVARGLHKSGHDVHVLTSDYFLDDEAGITDFPVIRTLECVEPSRLILTEAERTRRGDFVSPTNLRRIGTELIAFRPDSVLIFNCLGLGVLGLLQYLVGLGVRPVVFLMDNVFNHLAGPPPIRETMSRVFGGDDFLDQVSF